MVTMVGRCLFSSLSPCWSRCSKRAKWVGSQLTAAQALWGPSMPRPDFRDCFREELVAGPNVIPIQNVAGAVGRVHPAGRKGIRYRALAATCLTKIIHCRSAITVLQRRARTSVQGVSKLTGLRSSRQEHQGCLTFFILPIHFGAGSHKVCIPPSLACRSN